MVPCKNVYNCILGRPFASTLDAMAFTVHLNLNYHNVHDDSMIIYIELYEIRRIYKELQCDQKNGQGKNMEINITSLIMQLMDMAIKLS